MSEKRFKKVMGFIQDNTCKGGDVNGIMDLTEIEDMLNEQQFTINKLKEENERLRQQIEIEKKWQLEKDRYYVSLQEENKQLKRQNKALKNNSLTNAYFNYLENSRTVTLKVVEESELFKFNKNCAKPYSIRSVSPNGVVRVGKKNSRVSWRMKDIREISAELPPFEDFSKKTFMQMRYKFRKFDKDVIGRIIYNIYIGTFEEYI